MNTEERLEGLKKYLGPFYVAQGGHDLPHVLRMERMFPEIAEFISGVDRVEYELAVWLHNVDRCEGLREEIKAKTLPVVLLELIGDSLSQEATSRIIQAILEHGKFKDGPNDSPVLQALRLADKWDRIGVLGGISGFQWLGCKMPAYEPGHPFGYGSTAEAELGKKGYETLYQNFYRIIEWYPIFPLIRELVERHPWRFKHLLFFIRAFAREVSEAHGVQNTVENDIEKCLGPYYYMWAPK